MKIIATPRLLLALCFALAIIASAFLLRGHAAQPWIESGLAGVALVFVVLRPAEANRR